MKNTIIETVTSIKGASITSAGLSAPVWVQYLETVINPLIAFCIAFFTALWMVVRFVNSYYDLRVKWAERKHREREAFGLGNHRKSDK